LVYLFHPLDFGIVGFSIIYTYIFRFAFDARKIT